MQLSAKRVRESEWDGTHCFEIYVQVVHLKEKNEYLRGLVEELKDKAPRPWLKPSAGCLPPVRDFRHMIEM